MANPTTGWDGVPVYGVFMRAPDEAPELGNVALTIANRITRTDGRVIYPAGAKIIREIGNTDQHNVTIRNAVKAAWRAEDEVELGEDFDGVAWDSWWDTKVVPASIFTVFPALDDPDIVNDPDNRVMVAEQLLSATGREYAIQPLLAHLDLPIPGVNLGTIEVPPGSPVVPAPVYAKNTPGGVAGLDGEGKLFVEQFPDGLPGGGVSSWEEVTETGDFPAAGLVEGDDSRLSNTRTPTDGSVTDAKVATGRHLLTTAQQSKLDALPADAQSETQVEAVADARISNWVGAAPGVLNTLDELAAALGDDPNFAATLTSQIAGKADDSAAVHKTGAETVAGVKTFSSPPVVPDGSFVAAKVTGVIKETGAQTKAGRLTLSDGVVLPAGDLPQTAVAGQELVWLIHYNSDTDSWPAEGSAEAPETEDMPAGMRRKMDSVGDPAAPMPTALLRSGITHAGHPVLDSWLPHRDSPIWEELA